MTAQTTTRTVRLVSGDEVTIPATLLDGDGENYPRFVGMSADGLVVVEAYGLRYELTSCCGASAKGSADSSTGCVCRDCYAEVPASMGGCPTVEADSMWQPDEDPVDHESLALVLEAAEQRVDGLRASAREAREGGAGAWADRLDAKAARLAEAVANLRCAL